MERLSFVRAPGASARRIGQLGYAPLGIRRAVVEKQLTAAFPDLARDEIERIARASYAHLGRTSVETAILPSYSSREIIDLFESVNGWDLVEERLALGQRADRRHRAPRQLGARRCVRRRARLADRRGRSPHGESALRSVPHVDARAHRNDGRARRGGGASCAALVAHRTLRGVSRRSGRGRTRVDVGAVLRPIRQDAARSGGVRAPPRHAGRVRRCAAPAVGAVSASPSSRSTSTETGDREADVDRIVADYTAVLERWVRRAPEQYFWHHRRWKHQRPGTPRELGDPL